MERFAFAKKVEYRNVFVVSIIELLLDKKLTSFYCPHIQANNINLLQRLLHALLRHSLAQLLGFVSEKIVRRHILQNEVALGFPDRLLELSHAYHPKFSLGNMRNSKQHRWVGRQWQHHINHNYVAPDWMLYYCLKLFIGWWCLDEYPCWNQDCFYDAVIICMPRIPLVLNVSVDKRIAYSKCHCFVISSSGWIHW